MAGTSYGANEPPKKGKKKKAKVYDEDMLDEVLDKGDEHAEYEDEDHDNFFRQLARRKAERMDLFTTVMDDDYEFKTFFKKQICA